MEDVCSSILKGPFGSDIKKSLYVPKGDGAYKVYIQVNAIKKDESLGDYYISNDYFKEKMHRFEVKPYDYIITCDGTLGKYLRLSSKMEKGIISASLLKITLKDTILPKFFEYLWDGYILQRLVKEVRNTALQHLPSAGKMSKTLIPVPPVQEQEKIVAELDCLSGIIEKKKQQLKELDNLAQSIFYDMFGDPYEQSQYDFKPLDAYCRILGRIGFRGYTREDFVETPQEGAISLSPSNIINGEMDYSKCSYITWFKYEESPEIKIYNGDILVVKTGSSYGKVARVKNLPHKASINPQFVVLKEVQCNRYFLEYYLKTPFARDKYEEFVIGTAIPTFSQKKLGTLPIADVPIELQNTFAQKMEAIERQKELIKKSIQETETLFNSRMDYWFN